MASQPAVIGIYGLSGSGKTFLLRHLESTFGPDDFFIKEGSHLISGVLGSEEGLGAFNALPETEKMRMREKAVQTFQAEVSLADRPAIIAGHYSFWEEEGEPEPRLAWTDADARFYTHIIFLRVDAADIAERRAKDRGRDRPQVSVEHLRRWQAFEMAELRKVCMRSGILFLEVREGRCDDLIGKVAGMCLDFRDIRGLDNSEVVRRKVDEIVASRGGRTLSTVLLVDGDKTLSPEDTGRLFWTTEPPLRRGGPADGPTPTDVVFRESGYSSFAFWQASLVHEEALEDKDFTERCRRVAQGVRLFPEMEMQLRQAVALEHVLVLVITSGIAAIWEAIVDEARPDSTSHPARCVRVLGGGRLSDRCVITPQVKGQVASRLREVHGLRVCALGDSPLDIPMLEAADEAFVVVGPEESRSRSMEGALSRTLDGGLRARQLLLPHDVRPRLDLERLPRAHVSDVMAGLATDGSGGHGNGKNGNHGHSEGSEKQPIQHLRFLHATEKQACRLLASPTRDARVSGPALQDAYARIGQYLALEYIAALLGLDETTASPATDVHGRPTTSYCLRDEACTAIVAIMRAGEPLARGISACFPSARYLHAKTPADLAARDLRGVKTVMLVDTVVNTGKTIIEFVEHVRAMRGDDDDDDDDDDGDDGGSMRPRLLVVAGVVQAETVREGHGMERVLAGGDVTMVALRVSENKYKGTRGLDTGNRMFNTTDRE